MPWPTDHLPPKIEPTVLEREMIDALNRVKAWRDCHPLTPFPLALDMQIEAILTTYEMRRTA